LLSAILNEGAQKGMSLFYLCIKDLVNYYRTHEGKPPSRLTQFPKQGIIAIDSLNGLVNYGGAPREGTQNAIENLLNASTQSQRILAFTGTEEEYLELLKTLSNSALADRLAGARRVKLEFPQTKDRAKFLEEMLKAEIQKATPGSLQEVANYLHKAIPENVSIRVLQGHIYTARGLGSAPPTLESVQRACFVQRNIPGFREEPLSPAIVLSTVSALTEISIPQIRGKLRTREISRARAIAAVALTELCQMGKSEVGAHLTETIQLFHIY
jgi:chromosomal replication initiation ATPase DnaA